MKKGQTLWTDDNKFQVSLFPLDVMDITQTSSPDSFSHCCGHPCDYVGTTVKYPIYAPFDCHLIYMDGASVGNTRIWQSDKEEQTPTGISYVCVGFTHDENPPYNTIGAKIKQGQLIGHSGIAGFVTADHTHIDQAKGQNKVLVNSGRVCASGNTCYNIQDSDYPYNIFFDNDTTIVNTMGYTFKEYKGGHPGPGPSPEDNEGMSIMFYLKRRIR